MRTLLLILVAWAALTVTSADRPQREGPGQTDDGGTGGPPPKG